jgi:hypothetical protein
VQRRVTRGRVAGGAWTVDLPVAQHDAFERWRAQRQALQCHDSFNDERRSRFTLDIERSVFPIGLGPKVDSWHVQKSRSFVTPLLRMTEWRERRLLSRGDCCCLGYSRSASLRRQARAPMPAPVRNNSPQRRAARRDKRATFFFAAAIPNQISSHSCPSRCLCLALFLLVLPCARLTMVASHARVERGSGVLDSLQRIDASWRISSASAREPSIR